MPIECLIDRTDAAADPADLYSELKLPTGFAHRPYTVINMVSTVDGKILIGAIGSSAAGLGSPTDQLLMRRIQLKVDCAIVGAGTLRPGNVVYRKEMFRAVVTRSGKLDLANRFFTDAPDKAIVFAPSAARENLKGALGAGITVIFVEENEVHPEFAARHLRVQFGINRLALEGGSEINFDWLKSGLIDELFLSFAPKLKGGSHLPTPVGGTGFPNFDYLPLELISLYCDADEFYFRYRVEHSTMSAR